VKYVIRKWTLFLAVFLAFFGSVLCIEAHAFSGGSGTPDDPYIITSAAELNAVRYNRSAFFRLGNDIDLTDYLAPGGEGYAKWGAAGWQPIGSEFWFSSKDPRFSGVFDGNRHKITGLWINRSDQDLDVGLFGLAYGAVIKNLGVEITNAGVIGDTFVGGLAGRLFGSLFYEDGEERDDIHGGIITNSFATGNVSGIASVGGLVGVLEHGSITGSYATGDVDAFSGGVGGLVGGMLYSSIADSYAVGSISGNSGIGGLVGGMSGSSIDNSFATGNVNGFDLGVSGLVGGEGSSFGRRNSSIRNSFATGNIRDVRGYASGLLGWFESTTITNSFRYINLTINGRIITINTPDCIMGGILTAAQLTTQTTYTDNGWLFYPDGSWHWDERGFPKLNIGVEDFPFNFSPD